VAARPASAAMPRRPPSATTAAPNSEVDERRSPVGIKERVPQFLRRARAVSHEDLVAGIHARNARRVGDELEFDQLAVIRPRDETEADDAARRGARFGAGTRLRAHRLDARRVDLRRVAERRGIRTAASGRPEDCEADDGEDREGRGDDRRDASG
jgi:hypothetical protein